MGMDFGKMVKGVVSRSDTLIISIRGHPYSNSLRRKTMSTQNQKIPVPNFKDLMKIYAFNATLKAQEALLKEKDPNQEPGKIKKAAKKTKETAKTTGKAVTKATGSFFSTFLNEFGYELKKKSQ